MQHFQREIKQINKHPTYLSLFPRLLENKQFSKFTNSLILNIFLML